MISNFAALQCDGSAPVGDNGFMMIRTAVLRSALAGLGLVAAISLSGCQSPGNGLGPTTAPPAPEPTQSTSPSPSSSETEAPTEEATPVSIPCGSVIDAQTMYDFNPNFGLLAKFSPDAGTLTARAVSDEGTVCRWINQTSGDTIDVSISQPAKSALSAAQSEAESGTSASGFGDAAYFSHSGGTGLVQIFDGPYWVTVTSVYFSSAGDANSLASSVLSSLP